MSSVLTACSPRLSATILLATIVLPALPTTARAQERPRSPQPLQELIRTEVVYPQDRGELQVTFASSFDRADDGRTLALPLAVEYGLTDAWQVEVEWLTFSRVRPAAAGTSATQGTGGLTVGTKYSVMDIRESGVHAAFGIDVAFPYERRSDSSAETSREIEPYVALAADVAGGRAQIFGSAGLAFSRAAHEADSDIAGDVREHARELAWNAGVLLPLRRLTVATEINVRHDQLRWRERELYVTPSVAVHLPRAWEVGVGVPIGLTEPSARVGLAVHVIYER